MLEPVTKESGAKETSNVPNSSGSRDKTIDGFRAVAALGVVFAHAISYHFGTFSIAGWYYVKALADPLAQTSVQIFFVISGYIITSLLLREEHKFGRVSIPAFYIRRACRIFPPLIGLLVGILVLRLSGKIALDDSSLFYSASFTCNIGDCKWWVAHTWSLSVEEQFYLLWPLLLTLFPNRRLILSATVFALLVCFLIAPFAWHSNFISFACIGIGALYASSDWLRSIVTRSASALPWLLTIVAVTIGPHFVPGKMIQTVMPMLILYLIFAGRQISFVRQILAFRLVQLLGLSSYSLYLWQQIFLAKPELYRGAPLPLWLLPIVVAASVVLIEQPSIRLGRRLSQRWARRSSSQANVGLN